MKYFHLIKEGVDVNLFLNEIASVENRWDLNTGRQSKIKVQREAESIPIRGLRKSKINGRKRRDVHESRYTTTSEIFPVVRNFLEAFADDQEAEISRAKLVRLKPGLRVYPHIDRGEYYRIRDRYHLILQSPTGSYMKCSDEEILMHEGQLWWFDNNQIHEARNDGNDDRIHFIFDLLPAAKRHLAFPEHEIASSAAQ